MRVIDEGAVATVELRFNHAGHPGERFGARLRLQEHLFSDLDFNADRPELIVAEHLLVALGELSFAGGDPMLWGSDSQGTRWYVDDVYGAKAPVAELDDLRPRPASTVGWSDAGERHLGALLPDARSHDETEGCPTDEAS